MFMIESHADATRIERRLAAMEGERRMRLGVPADGLIPLPNWLIRLFARQASQPDAGVIALTARPAISSPGLSASRSTPAHGEG
ncbi:MAG: hypothetical protein ACYDCQ_08910 [Dehalococcoidia bacterium]